MRVAFGFVDGDHGAWNGVEFIAREASLVPLHLHAFITCSRWEEHERQLVQMDCERYINATPNLLSVPSASYAGCYHSRLCSRLLAVNGSIFAVDFLVVTRRLVFLLLLPRSIQV